jgi:hypothetical protein
MNMKMHFRPKYRRHSFPSPRVTTTDNPMSWYQSQTVRSLLGVFFGAGLVLAQPCAADSGVFSNTGSLNTERYNHTATLLPNGKVLVAGGVGTNGNSLASAELYDPASGTWTATGNLHTERVGHTATLLPNGKVLVAGGVDRNGNSLASAELYNPASGTWTATGDLNTEREDHTATLLPNGKVLVAGGANNNSGVLASAELYNPASGTWTATGSLHTARYSHTATLLPNGKVVVAGGANTNGNSLMSAELYDPASGTWTATGSLNTARYSHTATLLPNGKVLVAGGYHGNVLASAELYNPASGTWTATGSLNTARDGHTATLLPDGTVLVAGGFGNVGVLASAELYDPANGTWTVTGSLNTGRADHTATLLPNGKVLVAGGYNGIVLATAELYGPDAPLMTTTAATNVTSFSATLNGTVNPNGLTTSVYFQYGTTTNYGSTTASQSYTGNTTQSVSASITRLSPSTRYHFRIVGTNTDGTSYGSDRTFTTLTTTGAPIVTTNAATNVASFSATLNGSLNPHGLITSVRFQYGPTASYGFTTPVQTQTGNTARNISDNISGLIAGHIYHFRIVASNRDGASFGSDRTFTTLSATGPPVVITNPATLIASFSATLNGSVDPHGLTTTVYFQYGRTTSYGLTTAMQSRTGNTYQNVAANISGLSANTIYHCRIVATNSAGTRFGSDGTFTTLTATGPPVVTTSAATNLTSSSATLNGSLDPHGLTTTVHFQYGLTTSYGHTIPTQTQTGNTFRDVTANISGLTAHTTYHFRVIATNSDGTRYGSDRIFTTP